MPISAAPTRSISGTIDAPRGNYISESDRIASNPRQYRSRIASREPPTSPWATGAAARTMTVGAPGASPAAKNDEGQVRLRMRSGRFKECRC